MDDALEAIQFLANSTNRVRVLEALTEEPTSRRELQSSTGVSRSTVSRTLDSCESRGWVESEGSRYWITPLGEQMISAFLSSAETTAGILHLGEAVNWMPEAAFSLDFRHFQDATVVTPTPTEPAAHFDHGIEHIHCSESFRVLASTALPRYVEAIRDAVAAGTIEFEAVTAASFYEQVRGDRARMETWLDLGDSSWVYDGWVPVDFHIADDTVLLWLGDTVDGDLEVYGLLESENPAVLAWAESLYEEYRSEAEPLDPALFSPE